MISDYLYQKASLRGVPLGGVFELSPVCNLHCRMCYVRKTPEMIRSEGKQLLSYRQWLALAEECRSAGTLYLLLTGGEPFLYPDFRELYESLHRMGFLLSINTNGTLIDEDALAWLKAMAPSRMNVTLYGASRETYKRICGLEDAYDRAVFAIRKLKEAGVPLVINASMIPENGEDLEKIHAFGSALDINTRIGTYMFPPIRREQEAGDSRFTPEEAAKMFLRRCKCQMKPESLRRMFSEQRERAESVDDWGGHQEEPMRCRAGRSAFWVSWEGKMTACGLTPFPLVTEPMKSGFLSSWQALTREVRQKTVLNHCRGCTMREVCNPCAATVYAECGDVNGKPEYLCRMSQCITEEISAYLKEVENETVE